ncbi:hypothetical protein AB0K09_31730 [Streptomyces sp. NPDC049577]|uniref:hypothetical protein n=1 Tax=Streptomyces sp. NPDC049577 TaxID=3155153 RepID=UPI0034238927
MRSARRYQRYAFVCAALVAALAGPPPAQPVRASAPTARIPDCLGREGGHDNPSMTMTNREWAYARNNRLGAERYATCRFVITHRHTYVDFSQRVMSDTFGACDGPAWGLELKAFGSISRSRARSRGRSVTNEITASIAEGLSLALGGSRSREESTTWENVRAAESNIKLDVPAGKRVYYQYAPWFQRSDGFLRMTYWKNNPGGRSRVEDVDLTTDTPIRKADGTPRLDYQTRWLPCPHWRGTRGEDAKKQDDAKKDDAKKDDSKKDDSKKDDSNKAGSEKSGTKAGGTG